MFKKFTYAIALTVSILFISFCAAMAQEVPADKPTIENTAAEGLSSIGEVPAEETLMEIAGKTAKAYASADKSLKPLNISVTDIGYDEAKVLKPIFITCYTASLIRYKSRYKTMSSRSGMPQHPKKVTIDISPIIEKYAEKYNVDPYLIRAIIKTESGFRPYAVSYCGASGLMQLMPGTAASLGIKNVFDPEQNIEAGTKYIRGLIDRMKDFTLAIAAYNAGPYNIIKHGGIPPFTETRNFVNRVLKYYKER